MPATSMPRNSVDFKTQFVDLISGYQELDCGDSDQSLQRTDKCEPIIESFKTGVFRIVIMGEVKKGKSSFINALLGCPDLLPIDTDVATSTIYKVAYGASRRYTVFFEEEKGIEQPDASPPVQLQREPIDIEHTQVAEYGTENGNPGNQKGVAFIATQLPSPLLKTGIAIVDTPGVGGLFKKHRQITFEYAPSADVIFFVVDSVESVIGKEEIAFLKELRKNNAQIVFVQTKADKASQDQVLAWKERNLEILSAELAVESDAIPYFVLSSKLKSLADQTQCMEDLEESGFSEFMQFVQQALLPTRDLALVRRWIPSIEAFVQQDRQQLQSRLAIAKQSSNRDALLDYQKRLQEQENQLSHWRSETWPSLQREYRNELEKLTRFSMNAMEDATLPENAVTPLVKDVRGRCSTPEEVAKIDEQVRSDHAALINSRVNAIIALYQTKFEQVFRKAAGRTLESMGDISAGHVSVQTNTITTFDASLSRTMRETYMGTVFIQSLGRRVAMLGGGGITALVAAGVLTGGTAIAISALGGSALIATEIWGYVRGYKQSCERQVSDAVRIMETNMNKTCQAALRAGRRELAELSAQLRQCADESFAALHTQMNLEFQTRRNEIDETRKMDTEANNANIVALSQRIVELESYMKELGALATKVSC